MTRNRIFILALMLVLVTSVLTVGFVFDRSPTSESNDSRGDDLKAEESTELADKPGDDLKVQEFSSDTEVLYAEASWAIFFTDFKALSDFADLIVVGKVEQSTLDPDDEVFTDHKVLVLETIKDDQGRVKTGDTIIVNQFGGMWSPGEDYEPVPVEFRDSPLMKEGDVSLLFLLSRSDGKYAGITPQTRFVVMDGKVYWLGAVYEDRNIYSSDRLQIEGQTLEEVVSLLREVQENRD